MFRHGVEITVGRPVDEVFAFLTDASNHRRWDPSSVEMSVETPGPWRTGTQFHEVRMIVGRNQEVRSEVVALEPHRRMDIRSVTGAPYHGYWLFEPDGIRTRLRFNCELEITGAARLLEPVIGCAFRSQVSANFDRLNQVFESSPSLVSL